MSNINEIPPMTGETVETDGFYKDERGREELLERGDKFPADVVLGKMEWLLVGRPTDEQKKMLREERENTPPRLHQDRGDK